MTMSQTGHQLDLRPGCYVGRDENGALRVAGSRVSLDSVVVAFRQGDSPESIRESYPLLSLEQVYGAIAYYLAHEAEVDGYLKHQDELWQQERALSERENAPFLARLRQRKTEARSGGDAPAGETEP